MNREKQIVAICFRNNDITRLFAQLVAIHGAHPRIVRSPNEAAASHKIITEILFLPELSSAQRENSLIVGEGAALNEAPAIRLAQPLTEEGVETALQALLTLQVQ